MQLKIPKEGFPQNNFQNTKLEELFLDAHCALADTTQNTIWNCCVCVCVCPCVHICPCVCFLFSNDYSAFPNWFVVLILGPEWLLSESYQKSSSCFNFYAVLMLHLNKGHFSLVPWLNLCVRLTVYTSILPPQNKTFVTLYNRDPDNALKLLLKMTLQTSYVCVRSLLKLLFQNCGSGKLSLYCYTDSDVK